MHDNTRSRRRALVRLLTLVLTALAVLATAVALLYWQQRGGGEPAGATGSSTSPAAPDPTGSGDQDPAEYRLAVKPMLRLPPSAAKRQPLADHPAGPPIRLPKATQHAGEVVPSGYDVTPRGALARLVAITETGLRTGTPQGYAEVYGQVSEPGAPPPHRSGMAVMLRGFYRGAQVDPADPATQIPMRFEPTHGLIKGTAQGGEYVVACVLGEFTAEHRGHVASAGVGDCQALRHTGRGWVIASGTPAYPAPAAWPGSTDCVRAGYRELKR
jgi:hypothetical protein